MIKAGEILILEYGDYSSFVYVGPLRVIMDIDEAKTFETFLAQWKPNLDDPTEWRDEEDGPSQDHFIAWLVTSGHVEAMDVATWDVGDFAGAKLKAPVRGRLGGSACG